MNHHSTSDTMRDTMRPTAGPTARPTTPRLQRLARCTAAVLALHTLAGCAPLIIGGALLGGGLVATDRRTTGTQLEDESIELKAAARVRGLATLGQVGVTSYNRILLVTGEVPAEAERAAVGQSLAGIDNVRSVVNELTLAPNSNFGNRSNDALLTTKVKATLLDAKDLQANAFKVVAERGSIFLMGRVTQQEADRSAELARAVSGVQRVVRVFEVLSADEVARMGRAGAGAAATAAAASAASAPAAKP